MHYKSHGKLNFLALKCDAMHKTTAPTGKGSECELLNELSASHCREKGDMCFQKCREEGSV